MRDRVRVSASSHGNGLCMADELRAPLRRNNPPQSRHAIRAWRLAKDICHLCVPINNILSISVFDAGPGWVSDHLEHARMETCLLNWSAPGPCWYGEQVSLCACVTVVAFWGQIAAGGISIPNCSDGLHCYCVGGEWS